MNPRRQLFEQMQQPRITNGHKTPNFWDGCAESQPDLLGKKLRLVAAGLGTSVKASRSPRTNADADRNRFRGMISSDRGTQAQNQLRSCHER